MYDLTLTKLRRCVIRDDRAASMQIVRAAIDGEQIMPRDGVELLLVLREGTTEMIVEAIEAVRLGLPGTYRYIPCSEHVFS
jgi:hypothetical protein